METPLFTIDFKNFIAGDSQRERIPDKGFSPNSYGLNLTYEKGMLYFGDSGTDIGSTTIVDDIIAGAPDTSYLGNDCGFVDESRNFYTLSGTTLTKRQTGASKNYVNGTTDIIFFKGNWIVTSDTDIALLGGTSMSTLTEDWWTGTLSKTALSATGRHPLEQVEDTLYIGDVDKIHTWDGTTGVYNAMTLPNSVYITSLRKHSDGRHLIAFCGTTADYSHTKGARGNIFLIDTVNLEFIREIDVETQVEGSRNVSGVTYVTYGKNFGYFDGTAIQFLRTLNTSDTTYSNAIGNFDDFVTVRDGRNILCFGNLGAGSAWWTLYRADGNSTHIINQGSSKIVVAYNSSGAKLYQVSFAAPLIYGQFFSNKYLLGQRMAIRRIEVIHTKTPASGTHSFGLYFYDESGAPQFLGTKSYTNNQQTISRYDVDIFTSYAQFSIVPNSGAMGFVELRVYGESIE